MRLSENSIRILCAAVLCGSTPVFGAAIKSSGEGEQQPQTIPDCRSTSISRPTPSNNHVMPSTAYPLLSIASGEEGSTILQYTVREDGGIEQIGIARTSGFPRLDEAAVEGAANWHYNPASKDGKPVACRVRAEVRWALSTDPEDLVRQGMAVLQPSKSDYPNDALKKGETGLVFVGLNVAPDGTVAGTRLSRHSRFDDLDQASLRLVSERVHPLPATVDGKPVMTFVPVAVVWSIDPKSDK